MADDNVGTDAANKDMDAGNGDNADKGDQDVNLFKDDQGDKGADDKSADKNIFKDDQGDKDADDKGDKGDKSDKDADDKGEGAPEKYEDFKVPEGHEVTQETLEIFTPVAKELNLTQEQAQKLIDLNATILDNAYAAQELALKEQVKDWKTEGMKDEEIGGGSYDTKMDTSFKGLKGMGTPALEKLLADTNLIHHPEIKRLFYRVGSVVSEDLFVNGDKKPAGDGEVSREDAIYDGK